MTGNDKEMKINKKTPAGTKKTSKEKLGLEKRPVKTEKKTEKKTTRPRRRQRNSFYGNQKKFCLQLAPRKTKTDHCSLENKLIGRIQSRTPKKTKKTDAKPAKNRPKKIILTDKAVEIIEICGNTEK